MIPKEKISIENFEDKNFKIKLVESNKDAEVERHIDDIKIMRDEINWRVKLAYNGSVIFVSIFTLVTSYILNSEKTEVTDDNIIIIGLSAATLIAIYIGILNANHLVEKRIEYYTLHLQKKILKLEGYPSYSWLSFLYGYKFVKSKFMRVMSSTSNAAVGMFQYGLPIIMAVFILLFLGVKLNAHIEYTLFFIISCVLVFFTFISTLFLLAFLSKMAKEQKLFYDTEVLPYLKMSEVENLNNKVNIKDDTE